MNTVIDYSRCPLTDAFSAHKWQNDRRQIEAGRWVYLCDLDNLKRVNDSQGHAAGDRYIKSAVLQLRDVFRRQSDKIYRVGGDEFIVISGYAPQLILDGVDLPFSIGAVQHEGDIERSLADADAAMYQQKHQRKRARRLINAALRVGALMLAFLLGVAVATA